MPRSSKREFRDVYEVGVYPKKTSKGEKRLFAYILPISTSGKKVVKLSDLQEVEIYEKGKLKERYTGLAPARTIRMEDGICEYNGDGVLICQTDRIMYYKKKHKGSWSKKGTSKKGKGR